MGYPHTTEQKDNEDRFNKMTEKEKVYHAIETELSYQDRLTKSKDSPEMIEDVHLGDAIAIMQYNLDKARESWYKNPKPHSESMSYLRKMAATCVKMGITNGMPRR